MDVSKISEAKRNPGIMQSHNSNSLNNISNDATAPILVGHVHKHKGIVNPLRLSIEKKTKKNKEQYLRNIVQDKLDSVRRGNNQSSMAYN